ncbi:MAG: hypothetical protein JO022_06105, partial [Acidobacteriaceae bacterium]|nr:hypothetical protein [Acidobacteriaceae bacterium]
MPLSELLHLALTLLLFRTFEGRLTTANGETRSPRRAIIGFLIVPTALLGWLGETATDGQQQIYHWLILPILAVLCWKLTTRNYDYYCPKEFPRTRLLLLSLAGAALVSEAAVPCFLFFLPRFDGWTHHLLLSLRLVMLYLAVRLASVVLNAFAPVGMTLGPESDAWMMYLFMAVHLSHYVVPGLAKLTLGTKRWGWMLSNQTHLLLPAAYVWGWGRFVPEQALWRVTQGLARVTPVCNAAALLLECGCLLAPFSAQSYLLLCAAFVLFHLFIFLLSGICFWQNI